MARFCDTALQGCKGARSLQQYFTKLCCRLTLKLCLQDIGLLYLFALVLQCLILIPYLVKLSAHHQDLKHIIWRLVDLLMYAAPPGLPLVLLVIGAAAASHLKKDGLTLMFPEIIKRGAVVDVMCFDKTGTLTHSSVRLWRY